MPVHNDLGNEARGLLALRGQLVVADCAFNLHVGAFGERGGEANPTSPYYAAMPSRASNAFTGLAILPVPDGSHRQHGILLAVRGGLDFGVFAEESN